MITYVNTIVLSLSLSPPSSVDGYFATASYDRTARLWNTDRLYPLRIFAGHDDSTDVMTTTSSHLSLSHSVSHSLTHSLFLSLSPGCSVSP